MRFIASRKQTSDSLFYKIRTADRIGTDRIRIDRHRTENTDIIRTDTGPDFPENPDKNETRTEHGQYCPTTYDSKTPFKGETDTMIEFLDGV